MDPGFFANSDPDVQNPDSDLSINKPMGSKMMFLNRLWRNLTKNDSVESAKYKIQIFSTCTYSF